MMQGTGFKLMPMPGQTSNGAAKYRHGWRRIDAVTSLTQPLNLKGLQTGCSQVVMLFRMLTDTVWKSIVQQDTF